MYGGDAQGYSRDTHPVVLAILCPAHGFHDMSSKGKQHMHSLELLEVG